MTKIIEAWETLRSKTNTKLNHLYFAIEAEYVALKLGLSVKNPAIKAMNQTLLKKIPIIKKEALKQKDIIDHSYSVSKNR